MIEFYLNYVGCKVFYICYICYYLIWFYLNYVGCKANIILKTRSEQHRFYLNYVGCKVRQLDCKTIWWWCFTLTMWDVKLISSIIYLYSSSEFYLNYVGCKGIHNSKNYIAS